LTKLNQPIRFLSIAELAALTLGSGLIPSGRPVRRPEFPAAIGSCRAKNHNARRCEFCLDFPPQPQQRTDLAQISPRIL